MAQRKTILATNEIYHVYNRGVEKRPIFLIKRDYIRFIETTNYYRFANCPMRFSYFRILAHEKQDSVIKRLKDESRKLVDIYAYCLMPNHIHFLLKQLVDRGISKFMAKVTNAYSHYFNTRHDRIGHLFQGNFGASRIEDDEQFIHVSRYIHLNPVSSYLIELKDLIYYEYSSFPGYINKEASFINISGVLSYFKNKDEYKTFVEDQAGYARKLENIKHLILEET